MQDFLFSAQGRISRKPYWLFFVGYIVCLFIAAIIDGVSPGEGTGAATMLFFIVSIYPSIVVQIKRWHDRDKSGWWILIGFIPLIGPLWCLIECGFLRGTEGNNQYGASPI